MRLLLQYTYTYPHTRTQCLLDPSTICLFVYYRKTKRDNGIFDSSTLSAANGGLQRVTLTSSSISSKLEENSFKISARKYL